MIGPRSRDPRGNGGEDEIARAGAGSATRSGAGVAVSPTALVLDGGGAQSTVLVRVLGELGWTVLTESGTRSSRSRWSRATVDLPPPQGPDSDPDRYVEALGETCARWDVALVAPSRDLTLEYCWRAAGGSDTIAGAWILAADRRTAGV